MRCLAKAASSSLPIAAHSPPILRACKDCASVTSRSYVRVTVPQSGSLAPSWTSTSSIAPNASACCSRRSPRAVARLTSCSTPRGRMCQPSCVPSPPFRCVPISTSSRMNIACPPTWSALPGESSDELRSRYGSITMPPRLAITNSPVPKADSPAEQAKVASQAASRQSAAVHPGGVSPDSPFPPIADYGFLSDCHTGALVASDGSIEWMCLPHFDSPSVFAAMLDRGAGSWRVGPYGLYVPAGRRYIPGTHIIETTWMTPQGWLRVVDALTIGPWHDNKHGSSHTRPPTDYDGEHLLVRVIECIQGEVQVEIVCEPVLDYGTKPARWNLVQSGEEGACLLDAMSEMDMSDDPSDEATGETSDGEALGIRLFSDIRMGIEGNRTHGRHTMTEGEKRFCALSWTEDRGGPHTVEQGEIGR